MNNIKPKSLKKTFKAYPKGTAKGNKAQTIINSPFPTIICDTCKNELEAMEYNRVSIIIIPCQICLDREYAYGLANGRVEN